MGRVTPPSAVARTRTKHLLARHAEGERSVRDLLARAYEIGVQDAAAALATTPARNTSQIGEG